jgi:hypothetical protein
MTIIIDVGSSKKARPELEMVKFKALIKGRQIGDGGVRDVKSSDWR